ncbi:CarD family transcriptional regulator [Sporomusa sp.]|uniref:CarD family transcriptional regulator n=1 Tax=Sporomusa sp. TaxID=2078658 RepID=UPI002D009EE1|nr:CarD family transcriptional regulator [Sporomusa sp.]HWR43229.1 CarD family transcriptional regulator [Sporomusa sp.]
MFKVNDYVIYGSTGVCKITDIGRDKYSSDETEYYILHPVHNNNMTIKTPVNNPSVLMRPILTKDEVLSLITSMPEKETFLIDNNRERSITFKAALKTHQDEELIRIIKTLYLEKQAKSVVNKKLTKTDEDIMNTAEKQLYEEFAIALNISPDEVLPYILEHISYHEE